MTREQQFWDWFKENEHKYYILNKIDDDEEVESLLDTLFAQLQEVSENLYYEIGGHPDESQDLIITADGNIDFFDEVESLVAQAPVLEHWNIIAFKPPKDGVFTATYNSTIIDPKTLWFMPLTNKSSQKIGLRIYVDGYESKNEEDFLNGVYIVLDNLLGERSTAIDIGYVEIKNLDSDIDKSTLIELVRLQRYVTWKKNKSNAS